MKPCTSSPRSMGTISLAVGVTSRSTGVTATGGVAAHPNALPMETKTNARDSHRDARRAEEVMVTRAPVYPR
jgi:hypothetical protein